MGTTFFQWHVNDRPSYSCPRPRCAAKVIEFMWATPIVPLRACPGCGRGSSLIPLARARQISTLTPADGIPGDLWNMLGSCRATTSAMPAVQSVGFAALLVALLLGVAAAAAGDEVPSHERYDHQARTQCEISIACS